MMRCTLTQRAAVGIVATLAFASLASCEAPPVTTAGSSVNSPVVDTALSQTISGTLGLKGSDVNAWWALEDDHGRVWRLVTTSIEQRKLLSSMQYRRVEVTGKLVGRLLANEQLQVERAVLLP